MAYDLEEQEQIASIKAWWGQYGNRILWLLIFGLSLFSCWKAWEYYQRRQSTQAAQLYAEVKNAVVNNDLVKVQRAARDMENHFPRTAYAQMSALAAAKIAFASTDLATAKNQLQWVIDHGVDEEYRAIAAVRLAGILLDEKSYDSGLKILSGKFPETFSSLIADRKGDIFVAQNKISEARVAYQLALDTLMKVDKINQNIQIIQLKLDAIGGAPTHATL